MAVSRFVTDKFSQNLNQIGKAAMHYKYPDEFEYYLIAFELVDSLGVSEDYMMFPIMPSQISKVENNRTSIKKSSSGTTILYSSSTTPNDLSLKGDFGKGFKLLIRNNDNPSGYTLGLNFKKLSLKNPEFDPTVRTGYGAIKILQRIMNNSSKLDSSGNPRKLYMYNLALGESYLCVVPNGGLTISQQYDRNMIWGYSLNLSLIANLEDLKSSSNVTSSIDLLKTSAMQNSLNSLLSSVSKIARSTINL